MLNSLKLYLAMPCNEGRRIRTISRYFLAKSLKYAGITKKIDWPPGMNSKMFYRPNCTVSEKCLICGKYDHDTMRFLEEQLGAQEVFYDVGANVGPFSILASLCGATVFAFEGAPSTHKRLQENFLLNSIEVEHALNLAVSDTSKEVNFLDDEGSSVNQIVEDRACKVKAVSIDDFAETHPAPSFVKIDTEGHELKVIQGMQRVLGTGQVQFVSFEANGLLAESDLSLTGQIFRDHEFLVGLLDFDTRTFTVYDDLGDKSPTGDYLAIHSNYVEQLDKRGYQFRPTMG